MAYCSECGVYYTDDGAICSSCGRNLRPERRPEMKKTPSVNEFQPQTVGLIDFAVDNAGDENMEINRLKRLLEQDNNNLEVTSVRLPVETPAELGGDAFESGSTSSEARAVDSAYFQADGHLGKGIIKPQKVELAADGVHFKYDTPSHNFIKAEPVKEKPREYRVTDLDKELKTAKDINIAKEHLEELIPIIEENVETVSEIPSPAEPIVSQEENNPDIITDEDIILMNRPETILEQVIPDLITEPSLPEPELAILKDTDVIWEAAQTWFKISLGNVYRVTGSSLIILGKYNNKLFEVSLALITGVSVRQSWFAKLFGVGDLLISIPEFSAPKVVLNGITKPNKVKQIFEELCNLVDN